MVKSKMKRNEMHSFKNKVLHGLFFSLYAFVKYLPFPVIGNYSRYLVLKLFLGKNIKSKYIGEMVTIFAPWNIKIGKRTSINQGVIIDGTGKVTIGNGVRIAPNVYLNTADHDFSDKTKLIVDQGFTIGEIIIEDDVWIGTGVIINKGLRIGKGVIIGAGSVVTKDIPPYSIAVGVPCRVIKKR